jgi:putative chitinase
MSKINRVFFFQYVKLHLFDGKLSQKQVDGLTDILDYWEKIPGKKNDQWLAYALATSHHETGRTMQPIREYGGNEYKRLKYDVTGNDPKRAKLYGNTTPGDGVKYAGAGDVQLTWKNNYLKAGRALGIDLVNKPELTLQSPVSKAIMFRGMMEGWFTGKKLSDYFTTEKTDWKNARRIINGTDKADLVASYAVKYYAAISYTV